METIPRAGKQGAGDGAGTWHFCQIQVPLLRQHRGGCSTLISNTSAQVRIVLSVTFILY